MGCVAAALVVDSLDKMDEVVMDRDWMVVLVERLVYNLDDRRHSMMVASEFDHWDLPNGVRVY